MLCDDADRYLDDYINETLDDRARADLESHLDTCDKCAALLRDLQLVQRQSTELEGWVAPERDLWPGIQSRIAPRQIDFGAERRRRRIPAFRFAFAAAALLAVVVGLSVLSGIRVPTETGGGERAITQAESEYRAAKAELVAALDAKSSALAPETLQTIQENLVVIESALAEIQIALNENPGDADLERMLYAAYRYEVELLHQAIRLADEG